MDVNKGKIKGIIVAALLIRLVVLFVIFVITPEWSTGFLSNTFVQDDVRYEMGAIRYAETAASLIDANAFANAYASYGDNVGMTQNIFSVTPLWYWTVCFLYYIFRNVIAVRIFNILCSVASVYYLYKLTCLNYSEQTATKAARLLAFLPYPVVFSCFSYKDNFIMVLTIFLIYQTLKFRINRKMNIKTTVQIVLCSLSLLLLRGGLSAILIVICLIIGFISKDKILSKKHLVRRLLLAIFAIAIAAFILARESSSILYKMQYYISARSNSDLGGISLVTITGFRDIYKLPLAFIFAIIMPIGFTGHISTWAELISIFNICMAPVAVGSVIDLFRHKKEEWIVIGSLLIYYCLSIIASIGIYRHYFSLIFIPILLYSHFQCNKNSITKFIWSVGTTLYTIAIAIYLGLA